MERETRSSVKAIQMGKLRGMLDIRKMYRIPNAWIKELCGMKKGLDKRIYEIVVQWLSHVERMERDRIARVYGRGW